MLLLDHAPEREFFNIINNISMGKSLLIRSLAMLFLVAVTVSGILAPTTISAESGNSSKFCKAIKPPYEVVKTVRMVVTAYSSTVDQTDDTPLITASGKYVDDGIIANNMLPFGTKIRIPELYGDKIFTVQDRMHKRKGIYHADIWFSS